MSFLGSRDRLPIGPRFDEVESPQVIISSKNPGNRLPNEEDIILSTQDGTLISYTEGWDGKEVDVTIELLDPDGIFISKIFSFYIDNLRAYFQNFSSVRSEARDRQIVEFFRREYAISTRPYSERRLVENGRDAPFTILEDDDFAASAFSDALSKLEKSNRSGATSVPELQKALDTVGINPEMFINVGYGHESGENYSGFKKLTMKNIVLNQDSNKEHTLLIRFVPNFNGESALDNDGDSIVRTNSEKGTSHIFPVSTNKNKAPVLFKARYVNDGKVANAQQFRDTVNSTLTSKRPEEVFINNTADIVFLIEELLESYLLDHKGNNAIVMLSPALEAEIKKQTELASLDPTASVALHNLSVKLAKCGIRVKVSQEELIEEEERAEGAARGLRERRETKFNTIKTIDYTYSLFLEVEEFKARSERVLDVIKLLYKEFQVYPNDIYGRTITNEGRIVAIYDHLYSSREEVQRIFSTAGKPPIERLRKIYFKEGLRENQLDGSKFTSKRVSREINEGFSIGNLTVIGDDYLIKGLMFPRDIAFTQGEYQKYANYIESTFGVNNTDSLFTGLNCNAVRFIKGSDGKGLSSYLERWSETARSTTNKEILIPDEYALRFRPTQLETILKSAFLFIAGSENSNVIEVTSEENNFAFAQYESFFNIGNKKGIKSARDFFSFDYNKQNYLFNLSEESIEEIVGNVMRGIYGDTSLMRIIEEITQQPINETQASQDLKEMYRTIINEIKDSAQVKNKNIDPKALTNYLLYTQNLAQNARKLVIKTSPSFFIDETTIKDPAIFFHKNPFITSSQSRISALSILNGLYQIIGYKHVINGSECYTEVVLLRNQLSETFGISANITDLEE